MGQLDGKFAIVTLETEGSGRGLRGGLPLRERTSQSAARHAELLEEAV